MNSFELEDKIFEIEALSLEIEDVFNECCSLELVSEEIVEMKENIISEMCFIIEELSKVQKKMEYKGC